jgi:DNA modification methylase
VKKQSRRKTATSTFGTSGRISHDSSRFYKSRLYSAASDEIAAVAKDQVLSSEILDRIFRSSSESMHQLADNSVHLMITSPPYNVSKEYDEDLTLDEYRALLRQVLRETHRVLVDGGRACVNVANIGRKPYIPIHAFLAEDMIEMGFAMRGEIIWNKGGSAGSSTAWGSWKSATNPTLRDVHEYILIFSKNNYARNGVGKKSTIGRDEFLEYTKSIWSFPSESARRIGHPAPFPIELPRRLIQLYSFEGDIVLDPFAGSGSTCIAALQTKRHFIAYEKNARYARLAKKRIREFSSVGKKKGMEGED